MKSHPFLLLFFVFLLMPTNLPGQLLESRLVPDDGEAAEYFGWTTAVFGDYAVIGSSEDDDLGPASGSAYIYKRSGAAWVQHQKLLASDGSSYDIFGSAVAISDSFVVIGARLDDDAAMDAGAVYIFTLDGDSWVEQEKIIASDGASIDQFGSSVAISGNILVAGASLDDDNGENSGSAYVFRHGTGGWEEEAKLLASDGAIDDRFEEVSISGNTIIVGAWGDQDMGALTGSAYIFVNSGAGWTQQAKLIASDQAGGDQFGLDVCISGDLAVVGAYANDDKGENSGSAYVFRREDNTWTQEAKLLPLDGAEFDSFGISVSINGSFILVGADVDDDNGENSGSAYLFRECDAEWDELTKITASDGSPYDYFGISVSLDANSAFIGAGGDDENGDDAGAAYVFEGFASRPGIPAPLAPLNGTVVSADTVLLMWDQTIPGGNAYWLEWSTDSLFSASQVDSTLTETQHVLSGLQTGETYSWRVRARNMAGWGPFNDPWTFSTLITSVAGSANRPDEFQLGQNYPNPFNPTTKIKFQIADYGLVELRIYDLLGRTIAELVNENRAPGTYDVIWDATGIPSGVYYYRISAAGFVQTRSLVLLK